MNGLDLGLDIGTSAIKLVLADCSETIVHSDAATLTTRHPRPGWAEQDPQDWWNAIEGLVMAIAPDFRRQVRSIGLSGQMHGPVCLDGDGAVLRPVILWNDGRAAAQCETFATEVDEIESLAGVRPMPGFGAPKLLWMQEHEPALSARIEKVLAPKDEIRRRLTGRCATDPSDASGMLWLDVAQRRWSQKLVEASGLSAAQMPPLLDGSIPAGHLVPELENRWGMRDVVVACGAGDVVAGSIGIGAIVPGDAVLSVGTSGQIFVVADAHRPAPGTLVHAFAHALPDRWFQMAAMLNGASALAWWARIAGDDPATIVAAARRAPDAPLFLPYLSGERTPLDDPRARGVFFGLSPDTDAAAMARAVVEGVAYGFALGLDALAKAGARPDRLTGIGGGARSPAWMQIFADILDRPVETLAGAEHGPALGAARLARMACTGEDPLAVCRKPPVARTFMPDENARRRHQDRIGQFAQLHTALKPHFSTG